MRAFNYEFNLSVELVENGAGKWIQIADINHTGEYAGLNQNQAALEVQTVYKLVEIIRKVLVQFTSESVEGKWDSKK